jgi:hypothetical protein
MTSPDETAVLTGTGGGPGKTMAPAGAGVIVCSIQDDKLGRACLMVHRDVSDRAAADWVPDEPPTRGRRARFL